VPRCHEHRDPLYEEEVDECLQTLDKRTTNWAGRQAGACELPHHKRQRRAALGRPTLGTQNAVISVGNTDRLVPNEGLVEVLVTEVVGVHDLGLKRILVADNNALRLLVVCTLDIAEEDRAMPDRS